MLALAPLLLLGLAPAAAGPLSLSGFYQAHQMEMGAAVELSKNGDFRYRLDFGAVSESAAGKWTSDGKTVSLTSSPMPVMPAFELVSDGPAPIGEVYLALEKSEYDFGTPLYAIVAVNGGDLEYKVSTDDDGRITAPADSVITAIAPTIPGLGPTASKFELSKDRGHRLVVRFHANDLGQARFDRQLLAIDHGDLLLDRYGTTIRFQRAKP